MEASFIQICVDRSLFCLCDMWLVNWLIDWLLKHIKICRIPVILNKIQTKQAQYQFNRS